MPTYDYQCDACGHEMELFQRITEDAIKKCPECKKNKLRRLFGTGAAVVFKGSGFYQTDYRSESYKKGQKAEAGDGKSKDSSSKSDSKSSSDSNSSNASSSAPSKSADTKKPSKNKD